MHGCGQCFELFFPLSSRHRCNNEQQRQHNPKTCALTNAIMWIRNNVCLQNAPKSLSNREPVHLHNETIAYIHIVRLQEPCINMRCTIAKTRLAHASQNYELVEN